MKYVISKKLVLLLVFSLFTAAGACADDLRMVPDSELLIAGQECRIAEDGEGRMAFFSIGQGERITDWFQYIDIHEAFRTRNGNLFLLVYNDSEMEGLLSADSGQAVGWFSFVDTDTVARTDAGDTFVSVFNEEDYEGLLSPGTGNVLGWFDEIVVHKVIEAGNGRAFVKVYDDNNDETLLALDSGAIFNWFDFVDDYVVVHTLSGQTFVKVSNADDRQSMLSLDTGGLFDWYYYIDDEIVLRSAAGDVWVKIDDENGDSAVLHLQTGDLSKWISGSRGRDWQTIRNEPCFFGGNEQGQVAFFSLSNREPVTDWHRRIHNTKIVLAGAEYLVAENAAGHFALIDVETGETASDWHEHFIAENATRRLMEALGSQDVSLIREVIEDGVDLNSKIIVIFDGFPMVAKPLYFLIEGMQYADAEEKDWIKEVFKLFIDSGTDVNGKIVDMREGSLSPFIAAYAFQDPEMIEFMLSRGTDANELIVFEADGQTGEIPLIFFPVSVEDIEVCRMMFEAGADINITFSYSEYGEFNETSLLHIAYETRNIELLQLLIDYGADTSLRDGEGMTVLDLAREAGDDSVIEILAD